MRRTLRTIIGIAVMNSKWIFRQPMWLVQTAFLALAIVLILWAWGGLGAVKHLIIAWFVTIAWSLGINLVGQEIGWKRLYGELQMFIASPATPTTMLAGTLLAMLVGVPFDVLPVALLALALNCLDYLVAGILSFLLLLPVATFMGLALAMLVKKPTNISAITNPVSSIFEFLPPVFYPATVLPPIVREIALITPTGAAAELARALIGVNNVFTPMQALTILIAWCVASFALAKYSIKWGHE